jgi:hypothetical protein
MKEFSPVIITSFGSTGGIGWSPFESGWAESPSNPLTIEESRRQDKGGML